MFAKNADQEAVSPGPEVVAHQSFHFAAKAFGDANDLGLFGDDRDAKALKLPENVVSDVSQEALGPTVPGDRGVNVEAFEVVEYNPGDNLAVLLDPHGGEWGDDDSVDLLPNEPNDPLIGDDYQLTTCAV